MSGWLAGSIRVKNPYGKTHAVISVGQIHLCTYTQKLHPFSLEAGSEYLQKCTVMDIGGGRLLGGVLVS